MKKFVGFLFIILMIFSKVSLDAQPTYARDIAPIIHKNCMSCHRQGEIGPMSFSTYEDVKNWSSTIKYVTSQRIMPPWKADPEYSRFLDENYLTDSQIKLITDWVDAGAPSGNLAEAPQPPSFPANSLLGVPDLVLSFREAYEHKGDGQDEYRYFVLPTGLTQSKQVKAIELRPGNKKIVHHALFFADQSGKAREYDNLTPEYGFGAKENNDFNVFEVINRDQYPGYVPGQKPRYYPEGLGQTLPANSDLVIQMHYAPWSVNETDSSTVNIFFAKENEVIDRSVKDYIMLPYNLVTGASSFYLLPNQVKKFEGQYVVPFDVSLVGIFPHMHLLGKDWEVYMENPDGTRTNLIKINDWDFNWQGGYYFDRYKIARKGTKIKAFATYDNTTSNPNNPTNPPKFVTWGEGTKDEMYYLPLLFVPYKAGDENVIFDQHSTSVSDEEYPKALMATVHPNPASSNSDQPVQITFTLEQGQAVSISLYDQSGRQVRQIRDYEFFHSGSHIVHLQPNHLAKGMYTVKIAGKSANTSIPVIISE